MIKLLKILILVLVVIALALFIAQHFGVKLPFINK
jgi:hypothetical protein